MSVENLLDLVGYNKVGFTCFFFIPIKKSCCEKVSHSLSRNRRLRATSPTSEATWRRRWTASRSSPPSEDTMRPTLCLGLGGTDHKHELWRTWTFLNKWYRTYSFINTRYYGSKEDYDKDAQTKYDNSRRYRDPISINDRWIKFANFAILDIGKQLYGICTVCWHKNLPLRSIVEDLTNVTAKNATLTRGWKECNVILFPILVFGVFCLAVVLVLIRYKVCANYDEEEKEEGDQEK